jgi:hypothetical protein
VALGDRTLTSDGTQFNIVERDHIFSDRKKERKRINTTLGNKLEKAV